MLTLAFHGMPGFIELLIVGALAVAAIVFTVLPFWLIFEKAGFPGATAPQTSGSAFPGRDLRSSSTMGDSGDSSRAFSRLPTRHALTMVSISGNMTAKGFSSLCFRRLRRSTAPALRASTKR